MQNDQYFLSKDFCFESLLPPFELPYNQDFNIMSSFFVYEKVWQSI